MGLPDKTPDGALREYLCTVADACEGPCREKNTSNGEVCCTECYTEGDLKRFQARQRRAEGRDDD